MNRRLYLLALITSALYFGVIFATIEVFKIEVLRLPIMDLAIFGMIYFFHLHEKNITQESYRVVFNKFWSGVVGVWIIKMLFQIFELLNQKGVANIDMHYITLILLGMATFIISITIIKTKTLFTAYKKEYWNLHQQNKFSISYLFLIYMVFVLIPFW